MPPFARPDAAPVAALLLALLVAGCGPADSARESRRGGAEEAGGAAAGTVTAERYAPPAPLDPSLAAAVDSSVAVVDASVDSLPRLTRTQLAELRRHLNEEQVATARGLGVGVKDSAALRRLVRDGALVELEDSTRYWVVRELDHSVPWVTPDAYALLEEIGRRFHARLDSLGLPRFRFEISSALRTADMQAKLRRGNANASRTTSSHQFGTTVDIAYNGFSAPADYRPPVRRPGAEAAAPPGLRRAVRLRATEALDSVGVRRAGELQGVLGRVLAELQEEGVAKPLRERSQPVFHLTLAAELPRSRGGGTGRGE